MLSLLTNLNSEQHIAVTLPNEPILILAGAGSGKTRVLITRIAWLIQQGLTHPVSVLAVTFTNKAAREMMERLSMLVPIDTRNMWIGTFHGLCNRMLRAHYREAELPATFQILDAADQLFTIKRLMKRMNIVDEKYSAKSFQYFINNAKELGLRPQNVDVTNNFKNKFVKLYAAYEEQCQYEGVVDFPELLLRSYKLLSRNSSLCVYYQAQFKHILVDEFQDTNRLQYAWLKLLAGKTNAIFAVGDDDQSIYAFRGANINNMHNFEHEFRVQHVIKLEQNYRSHGHILNAANQLIAHNAQRLGKNLRTNACHGELVRVYEAITDTQEANWVVEEIRLLLNAGVARNEIAVLYRSNAQSRALERTLTNVGIPYRVFGGLRFFERQEVKHALAYLRLINNPNDDTAFVRVINFPARHIGARSIEQLSDMARLHRCSMMSAIPYVTSKVGSNLVNFANLIEKMHRETRQMSLSKTVEYVLHASGLIEFYRNACEWRQNRLENLQELINAATVFVSEEDCDDELHIPSRSISLRLDDATVSQCMSAYTKVDSDAIAMRGLTRNSAMVIITPLTSFLSYASLEAGENQASAGDKDSAVQLMTVHAAKGLEFTAVFITGLEEGLFPHENSAIKTDGLEEERRLMYVAITRAKERLYLSFSQSRLLHGQTCYNTRSRFFDELPQDTLKWLTPQISIHSRQWEEVQSYKISWRRACLTTFNQRKNYADTSMRLPAFANEQRTTETTLRVGQQVFHTKFGEGTIMILVGDGTDAKAKVFFKRYGEKWLALMVANLHPLND